MPFHFFFYSFLFSSSIETLLTLLFLSLFFRIDERLWKSTCIFSFTFRLLFIFCFFLDLGTSFLFLFFF
ncbi:hypothetical protein C1646_708078 [Rhizophagus diaphanus]|nr:hypothetical protein C1646_708078 [Rhizophagus diaphanus] [Rhizophagus sp. MUCL 43196]